MARKHVVSRFSLITDEFIDACQQEYRSNIPLQLEEKDEALFPRNVRTVIARESIDADRLIKAGPEILVERELDTFGDWMLVCLSEFLQMLLEDAKEDGGSIDPEILHAADRRAVESLFLVANSDTASPLVNYEALNGFLAASLVEKKKPEAIDHLVRALAFQLDLNDADGSDFDGLDLVSAWNQLDEFEQADEFLAKLVQWRPDDPSLYELASYFLGEAGRFSASEAVARRGLELVTEHGDPDDQAEALKVAIEQQVESAKDAPGTPASDALMAALQTPFDQGTDESPADFCAANIPGFSDVKKKRPLTSEDVDKYEELEVPETYRRATPKVGRNDPCPCGSGKKFKKCCAR